MASGIENEVKIRVAGEEAGRRRLEAAGFEVIHPRAFESNTIFDTAGGTLRRRGMVLRLRRYGESTILTLKGPAGEGRHKSRQETEIGLTHYESAEMILKQLGFFPVFIYEKYRTEWKCPERPEGVATLDETPIGAFLELEGPPDWIDGVTSNLGFSERDHITASYGRLYVEHCHQNGHKPVHLVFSSACPSNT